MSTKAIVVTIPDASLSTDVTPLVASAGRYAEQAMAKTTRRGYESDWRTFTRWCASMGAAPLPAIPQTVALYFAHLADEGKSYQTITRASAAIRWAHEHGLGEEAGSPTQDKMVRMVLRGIANTIGRGVRRRKTAATLDDVLRPMVAELPDTVRGHRDKVVLLLGFSGAFRRSELAGLLIEDLEFQAEGAVIRLRRSKTDQAGQGTDVAIPAGESELCPVRALRVWIEDLRTAGIVTGHLILGVHKSGIIQPGGGSTDRTINRIVKSAAVRAGIDPKLYGAHSLRSGMATQAAIRGKGVMQIATQGRWKHLDHVLRYYQAGTRFDDNAAGGIGL